MLCGACMICGTSVIPGACMISGSTREGRGKYLIITLVGTRLVTHLFTPSLLVSCQTMAFIYCIYSSGDESTLTLQIVLSPTLTLDKFVRAKALSYISRRLLGKWISLRSLLLNAYCPMSFKLDASPNVTRDSE